MNYLPAILTVNKNLLQELRSRLLETIGGKDGMVNEVNLELFFRGKNIMAVQDVDGNKVKVWFMQLQ